MTFLKIIVTVLAIGLAGATHAERLVSWQVQGHITSIDVPADPAYAELWSKFQPGQTYVATFLLDLDAKLGEWGSYRPVKGSTVNFKEAGLAYQMNFINGGVVLSFGQLDLGWGYASGLGGTGKPGLAYSFGGFSSTGGPSTLTLEDCDKAIKANSWSHSQPVHFGFVGEDLMSLGAFVHATVDSLSSSGASAVPDANTSALVLAGLPCCMVFMAVQRRAGATRSWRLDR